MMVGNAVFLSVNFSGFFLLHFGEDEHWISRI